MNPTKILICLIASMFSLYTVAKPEKTVDPAFIIYSDVCKVAEKEKIISRIKTQIDFLKLEKEHDLELVKLGNNWRQSNFIYYDSAIEVYQKCLRGRR